MTDYVTFYEVISGSRAYGFANEHSDVDIRGIAFPSYEKFFGMGNFEFAETKEPDKQIYSLKKFIGLALNSNPNILELLFIDEPELILKNTNFAKRLKLIREEFITQKIYTSYMGYAKAQMHKLKNAGNCGPTMGSNRFEGIQKFGYDTKAAAHVVRLLNQGIELANTGKISIPLYPKMAEFCKKIRTGNLTFTEFIEYSESLFNIFKESEAYTHLPEKPNYEMINKIVIAFHCEFYDIHRGKLNEK